MPSQRIPSLQEVSTFYLCSLITPASQNELTKEPVSQKSAVEDRIETEDDRALDWWLNKVHKNLHIV